MNILVCLKQIVDPEISVREFQIDEDRLEVAPGSANLVTNIFCENALETALQLREACEGEITALTFGPQQAEDTLRKALALRADRAVRVDNADISRCGSAGAACVLAGAIEKLGPFDLIMLGREAGDWGEGQTGGLVAERLGLPCVAFVDRIAAAEYGVRLERQTELGREELEAKLPLVVSITNSEDNVPRIPKTRDIMLAHRKDLVTWSLEDVGLDSDTVRRIDATTQVVDLFVPGRPNQCEFITGDTTEERIDRFAIRMQEVLRSV